MNDIDVREIREKSGLTQEELAERMGVSSKGAVKSPFDTYINLV